ncbi:DUF354 domain-containing protein [Thermococcus sibiricus]|nr:DUF354 domain-containing protein [Thermococcus sibiricus]
MNILIVVNTPAQAHFYKNIYTALKDKGHSVFLLARNYGDTIELLNSFGFDYIMYSDPLVSSNKLLKTAQFPLDVMSALLKTIKNKIKPDVIVGGGGYGAIISEILNVPNIWYMDGEPMFYSGLYQLEFKMFSRIPRAIITPKAFRQSLGNQHIKVDSYKELSYLSPKYYNPNPDILHELGVSKHDTYLLLRFNAFDALHDVNLYGLSYEDKIYLIKKLEKLGIKFFISSELPLPAPLEKYKLSIPKHRIHDVIYYSSMLVADTGTMVTEAAVLGVPAVMINSSAWKVGVFEELEERYGLIYRYSRGDKGISKVVELSERLSLLKRKWKKKQKRLLKEKIDISAFMTWVIENYPQSLHELQENPKIQYKFKAR